jgi:hypothetical protein
MSDDWWERFSEELHQGRSEVSPASVARGIPLVVEYLLSKEPLSDQGRLALMWLIAVLYRRLGRPRGGTKGAVWDAERWIVPQVQMFKEKWRAKNNRTRVPKAETVVEIKRLIPLAEARYPAAKGKIDIDHIIDSLLTH